MKKSWCGMAKRRVETRTKKRGSGNLFFCSQLWMKRVNLKCQSKLYFTQATSEVLNLASVTFVTIALLAGKAVFV